MSITPTGDGQCESVDAETFTTRYDADETPSETVVRAVAAVTGQHPERMQTRLADVVDPDALDRLFDGEALGADGPPARAAFDIADCRVVVDGRGTVTVVYPLG
jgi:hypothetical protein